MAKSSGAKLKRFANNLGGSSEKVYMDGSATVSTSGQKLKNFANTLGGSTTFQGAVTMPTRGEERKPGDIRAFGAGEYKSNKADKTVNAGVGYSVASYLKLLSDAARPTGELTMGQSAQAAVKGISQQEAEKQKRKESKANEWSKSLNESAVDWYEKAQENEAEAREDLGRFGNLLVSAGIAGTQMAGDTALNLIAPGSGIYAMAGRAYGSGSLEAQAKGLSEGQQQIAGIKSAAIETLTEKLFGFGSKVAYGSGLVKTPKLIESAITRLAKTNAGRTALRVLVGANEEGLEEVLSDLLNPVADRLLGLDSGTGNVYADLEASQVLEDYLVGGILGMFGGGTQVISGETKRINEQQRAAEQAQRDIVGKGLDSAEGTHSRLLAEEYSKILADSGKRGHRYLYDDEVNNLRTALDMENRSGNAPNADAFNAAQQIKTQQDAAMRAQGARVFGNNDISSDIAKAIAGNSKKSPSVKNEIGVRVSEAVGSKTAILDSGAKAKISNIEVKDGKVDKVVVETDEGVRKVSPKEVTVDSTTAKLLGDSVLYGEDAPMLMSYYQQGEDVDKYISAFDAAYNLYGKGGVEAVENSAIRNALGAERFNEIVKLGRAFAPAKATVKKTKTGKGSISYDGGVVDGKNLKAVDITKLTKEQAQQTKVIEQIAEKFGINFVFYESEVKDGKYTGANGAYTNNTIYLDINAGKNYEADPVAIVRTAAHELTHYMQAASPELYAEFKAVIVDKLINSEYLMGKGITFEDLVNSKMRRSKGTISEAEAVDEVIADACEMMLKNSKAMRTVMRENQKVGEKIKAFLKDFFRKMHEIFKNLSTAFPEAKALLDEQGKYLDDLQAKWDAMLVASAKSDTYTYESEVQEMTNENGETVVVADNNGHAQTSLRTYREGGREALEKYLDKRIAEGAIDKSERNDMLKQMDTMYQICENYAKEYSLFGQWSEAEVRTDPVTGEPIFSVVKANGDYALNLDFSLVCKKRRTLDAVFNEMISQGIMDDFDMVERSIAAINDIIRENDFETACALCFVDTKRYRQAMVADSFVRIYNGLVRSMVKDSSQKLTYFNFGENKALINPANGIHTLKDSDLDFTKIEQFLHNPKYMPKQKKDGSYTAGSVEYRVAKLLKESPQDRQLLQRGDFMSTKGFDNVRQYNTRVLGLYNAKKGAGGPKAAQSDVQYLSEILTQKKFNPKAAYAVGGVRVQSFSDYIPRLVFDYVQMMADLAAKDLPAHAYTKEPLFALQFGKTGMKVNMSLVPEVIEGGVAPGLDKDGNYAWRDGQSFGSTVYGGSEEFVRKCYDIIGKEYNGQDRLTAQEGYELAMAIQNADGYHNNCGTIAVGVSNAHILKLIRDPDIRMVIPYHKSSLNHLVAVMTNVDKYVNYTEKQNTRLASGKKLERGDFNFNEALRRLGDAKAAADEYLAWCDEHNYIPKFEDFRNEENYYKLLEDFTCYDRDGNAAPQGAVQVNFPTADDAFGSMSDLIEMGLIEDTNLNAKQTAKVPEIVKQIKATLPELEQKWKDEANAKKKPKKVQMSDRDNFSSADGESLQYSVREEAPPKTTKIGYKVFKVRNGQFYPTKVKNPSGQGTPLGVWLNADTGELARDADGNIKTNTLGRISVKADGGTLAWRPGWHLGELPEANQMNISNPNADGKKSEVGLIHEDYVFCECEFAADVNYQMEAFQMGFNKNGNYQHKLAGLPYLPKDGYYRYRTNPDPNTSPWFISGAIKITRILDDAERKAIIDKYNAEHSDDPMYYAPRKGGDLSGKAFEKRFGFKAGSVTASDVSGMAKGVDYSDEIRNLAGYAPQKINWDNEAFKEAFAINKTEKSYEDYRKEYEGKAQMSERDYIESDNSARMTNSRIDYLIEDSGAGRKKDYAQMWITSINPTDFINLTTSKVQDRKLFDKYPGDYGTTVDEYDFIEGLKSNMRQTPYLNIDEYGNVIGHEGRHRMRALERKGITSAEIVVKFYDADGSMIKNAHAVNGRLETIERATFSNQMGTGQTASVENLVPLNLDHKDEVLESYGEDHAAENDIRYSDRDTVEKAVEYFGTTENFDDAGYILWDGRMLDFSPYKEKYPNFIAMHHETISEVMGDEYESPVDAANAFIGMGNVRILSTANLLNLPVIEDAPFGLTKEQYSRIWDFIESKNGEVAIDIYEGDEYQSIADRDYDEGTNPRRIINEIKAYYRDGYLPEEGVASQFHYQERELRTDREILSTALESAAKNENERGMIKDYQRKVKTVEKLEQDLRDARQELADARKAKDEDGISKAQNRVNILADKVAKEDAKLLKLQAAKPLQNVLTRSKQVERETARVQRRNAVSKAVARERAQKQKELERVRESRENAVDKLKKHNKQVKENASERKEKSKLKAKIRKKLKEVDSLYRNGGKERNIKEGQKDLAASVLAMGDVLFSSMSNEDIARAGVSSVTEEESKMLNSYSDLLNTKADIEGRLEALRKSMDNYDEIDALEQQLKVIEGRISALNTKLKDVFTRERNRLQNTEVSTAVDELANAYFKMSQSSDDYIRNAYNENVHQRLLVLSRSLGGTTVDDMSIGQLQELYDNIKMVFTTIRQANKLFRNGKLESIEENGKAVIEEVGKIAKVKSKRIAFLDGFKAFDWNNMKPVYVFKRIGSKTLQGLYEDCRKGEDVWARDIAHARTFIEDVRNRTGFYGWDMDKVTDFELEDGRYFSLNLQQVMSIYAYSFREQAADHMSTGGFVYDNKETFKERKLKGIVSIEMKTSAQKAFRLSPKDLSTIIDSLTAEQRQYVTKMQKYLSDVMGAKGNEVSRVLYGIDLFKEENYFPLMSSRDFIFAANTPAGEVSLKNSGMTKETIPHASNPIVLQGFDDVWASHVNKMSVYHALAVPIDNFNKVNNYSEYINADESVSVKSTLTAAFNTTAVNDYISGLIKDLNGGITSPSVAAPWLRLVSKFKKNAVAASASVVVQQPTAIARAMAVIDPKYFIGTTDKLKHNMKWEQLKRYAPVAIIKEMGGFDTGSGVQAADYLKAKTYSGIKEKAKGFVSDSDFRDKTTMWAAAKADEIGWIMIWDAVKREVRATTDLKGDEFLERCGERFTEVICETQVYDSVFSRSANMRDKGDLMKMATAFMGEPTTSLNIMQNAIIQAHRGTMSKAHAGRAIGAVYASIVLATLAKSFVYAARDDDDEESFLNKYIEQVGSSFSLTGDLNPLTMLPFIKDIVNKVSGWDVERSDMAIISDVIDAYEALGKESKSTYRKIEDFGGALSALIFDFPLKNIMRDIRGIMNLYKSVSDDIAPNRLWDSFEQGWAGKKYSRAAKLQKAIVNGDADSVAVIMAQYANESAAKTQYKKACWNAYLSGELSEEETIGALSEVMNAEDAENYVNIRVGEMKVEQGNPDAYKEFTDAKKALGAAKKEDVLELIDEYFATVSEKDAMYRAMGYSEKNILEAPWH